MKKLPNKTKARQITHKAISDGLLIKKFCEVCGNEKSEIHHLDYSKPLNIKWLCKKHHVEWHRKHEKLKGFSEYKAIFISPELHQEIKVAAAEKRMTIIQFINNLIVNEKKVSSLITH